MQDSESKDWVALEIMAPIVEQGFWFKFLSIFNLVFQALHALGALLSCWGVLVLWAYILPIWSSISSLGALADLQRGLQRKELVDVEMGARKLARSIQLLGIATLIGLILFVLALSTLSVLVLVFGVDLTEEMGKWMQF